MGSAIAAPLSFATLGLSAASDVMKGEGQKSADDFKAAQQERAATYGRLKAQQTDAQMLEQENTQLGNIDAIRAAAGADPTSPTSYALKDRTQFLGDRNRSTAVDSILAQAQQDDADANYMKQAGDFALTSSFINAGTDIGKGLAKGYG
jgi:hypothetical protein